MYLRMCSRMGRTDRTDRTEKERVEARVQGSGGGLERIASSGICGQFSWRWIPSPTVPLGGFLDAVGGTAAELYDRGRKALGRCLPCTASKAAVNSYNL